MLTLKHQDLSSVNVGIGCFRAVLMGVCTATWFPYFFFLELALISLGLLSRCLLRDKSAYLSKPGGGGAPVLAVKGTRRVGSTFGRYRVLQVVLCHIAPSVVSGDS